MPAQDCVFCLPEVLSGPTLVSDFKNWVLLLNQYQFLPGTCILVSKDHREGLSSLSGKEIAEAHEILKRVEAALRGTLSPDWFNYLQTNNSVRHLHFHVIPRYERPVRFHGEDFIDENFEGMPVERQRTISKESRMALIDSLRSNL